MTQYFTVDSPVAELVLGVEDDGTLVRLEFADGRGGAALRGDIGAVTNVVPEAGRAVVEQLGAYFEGHRRTFDLPLRPRGTEFQLAVWAALRDIPYGQTRSYLDIAEVLGNPGAVRAVGRANGQNPIAIVVPCHRVIGADGSLTGFGGGLGRKRALLALENALPQLSLTL